MTIPALITDSTALLSSEQVAATGARVVPVTVTINGVDHLDGVDLDVDAFYRRLSSDADLSMSTAQPSPARFLEALNAAERAGAASAVAVLVGSAYSGTLDSARTAAMHSPIPVTCVDTGQASFGIGLCVLRAAEVLAAGGDGAEVAREVELLAATIESVFIIQARELALASGRFVDTGLESAPEGEHNAPIPVLKLAAGELSVVGEVVDLDEAIEVMAREILASGRQLRVASGLADPATAPVAHGLEQRLLESPLVEELLHYRVGPSVAANTGPGTAGTFHHPL